MSKRNHPTRRSTTRRVRPALETYDALPPPIRAALQEGPVVWDPGIIQARYRRWKRIFGEAEAIDLAVSMIGGWHAQEILAARPWQPPEHGRRLPLPSPHILARATMQTSGREVAP